MSSSQQHDDDDDDHHHHQVMEDERGEACGMHAREDECIQGFGGETCVLAMNNIKYFEEIGWDGMDYINLVQDGEEWAAAACTVMSLWILQNAWNTNSQESISSMTLLHGVS